MHRNTIIAICAGFCAVAVIAGLFVGSLSSASQPIAVVQTTPGAGEAPLAPTASALADVATNTPRVTAEALMAPTNDVPDDPTNAPAATDEPTAAVAPTAAAAPTAPAAPTAEPTSAPTTAPVQAAGFVEYTVQRGDELLALANKYNVSVKEILANNQIANPDSLVVGQVLRIPQK